MRHMVYVCADVVGVAYGALGCAVWCRVADSGVVVALIALGVLIA